MPRLTVLPLLCLCVVGATRDASADISFKSARTETSGRLAITYEVGLKDLKDKAVVITIPNAGGDAVSSVAPNTPVGPCTSVDATVEALVLTCQPKDAAATATVTLTGSSRRLRFTTVNASATVAGASAGRWEIDGLGVSHDERFLKVVVGGGISVLGDDHVNFKTDNGALRIMNDSKLRTSALFGGQFHLKDVPWRHGGTKELSALLSLEFTQGTTRILDGFQFGLGWELSRYLTLVGGFALRRGEELSHGFEQAASGVIVAQQAANNADYARFPTLAPGEVGYGDKALELLDGLPLTTPGTTQPFFSGSPILESYNRSVFVGFVVPVNLGALLSPQ